MKMFEILELDVLLPKLTIKQLPIRTLYKINKLIEMVEKEKQFYQSHFQEIVDSCAERDENGQYIFIDEACTSIKIISDKIPECQKRMDELSNIEISNIPDVSFTFDELDSLTLSYAEARPLMNFINE